MFLFISFKEYIYHLILAIFTNINLKSVIMSNDHPNKLILNIQQELNMNYLTILD